MQSKPLEIRVLPIDQIQEAPYNPRLSLQPGDVAYEKLRDSLEHFGLVEPLIWNATTGNLVGGHARLQLLRDAGLSEVPVSVVHLTDEQEKALNIILNNPEAQGRFDREKLHDVLEELHELPEFSWTGFDESIMSSLVFAAEEELPAEPEPDHVEVILKIDKSAWPSMQIVLDDLVRQHDLIAHIRQ